MQSFNAHYFLGIISISLECWDEMLHKNLYELKDKCTKKQILCRWVSYVTFFYRKRNIINITCTVLFRMPVQTIQKRLLMCNVLAVKYTSTHKCGLLFHEPDIGRHIYQNNTKNSRFVSNSLPVLDYAAD